MEKEALLVTWCCDLINTSITQRKLISDYSGTYDPTVTREKFKMKDTAMSCVFAFRQENVQLELSGQEKIMLTCITAVR